MVVKMGANSGEGDSKPKNETMGTNTKNPMITKNKKKEKDWHKTLFEGCIASGIYLCPIITLKSLGCSSKDYVSIELGCHVDTNVKGSNVLVIHNHEC